MFLNDTILMTMFTINMMTTVLDETEIHSLDDYEVIRRNTTTTTLSPEKGEDTFNLEDGRNENKEICIYI